LTICIRKTALGGSRLKHTEGVMDAKPIIKFIHSMGSVNQIKVRSMQG
jgi:hypothetical protein